MAFQIQTTSLKKMSKNQRPKSLSTGEEKVQVRFLSEKCKQSETLRNYLKHKRKFHTYVVKKKD